MHISLLTNWQEFNHLRGDYISALMNYNIYLSEYEEVDEKITSEINFLSKQAIWARDAVIESNIEKIDQMTASVNSPYSENSPFISNDSLYFSSLRFPIEKDELNRYKSKLMMRDSVIDLSGVDLAQLVSNISFSPENDFAVFTICDYNELYDISCGLYHAFVDTLGKFSKPTKLPETINFPGSTTTHPNIRLHNDQLVLFFSSDRPGGKGERDIWKSNFTPELNFDLPENLSYINTARDDVTPFFHEGTNILYFSSNGHNGFGGYDIYSIEEDKRDSISISNAGNKLNSPHNDLYPFVNENASEVYLSSNRPGSMFLEAKYETCCYDIYKAEVKECKIDLLAEFYDSFDDTELNEVSVQILDKTNDIVIYNDLLVDPSMSIMLDCDKEYEIIALKRGYQDLNYPLDNINPIYGQINKVERKIFMNPSDYNLSIELYDEEETDLALTNAEVTLINIETEEEKSLSNGESNIYNFEILPKTSYRIIAKKLAYDDKIVEFNSGVGEPDIEKIIYLKKTEIVQVTKVSLSNAIPVRLYFDNDEPDRKTMSETSSQNYTQTFYKYYDKKEKFKSVYSSKFSRSKKDAAVAEIEDLFEAHIRAGFDKYERFKNQLLIVLEAGQNVNIYLRGYASPVHQNDYNTALGKRRVDSIRKEFDQWNNGIFLPYLRSGQLIVTERSFGEETAPPGISDDPASPGSSIFSPEASIERRVEIDEINFNEN